MLALEWVGFDSGMTWPPLELGYLWKLPVPSTPLGFWDLTHQGSCWQSDMRRTGFCQDCCLLAFPSPNLLETPWSSLETHLKKITSSRKSSLTSFYRVSRQPLCFFRIQHRPWS